MPLKKRCWQLIIYDVWGNRRDGFEVNDKFKTGQRVEIADDASDSAVIRAMRRAGMLRKGIRSKSIELDGDDQAIYVTDARDGRPAFELIPCDDE